MKRKMTTIIACICMCIMLLTGCGTTHEINSADKTQVQSIEPTDEAKESVEPIDELSQRAQEIINNYQGDGSDEVYKDVEGVVLAENTRLFILAEVNSIEYQIHTVDQIINFVETHGGSQELISFHEGQKEKLEEELQLNKELLLHAINIEEYVLQKIEES